MRGQSAKTRDFKNNSYYVGLHEGYSFKLEVFEIPKVTLSNFGHFGVPQFFSSDNLEVILFLGFYTKIN
jgi:hypothetical protein